LIGQLFLLEETMGTFEADVKMLTNRTSIQNLNYSCNPQISV